MGGGNGQKSATARKRNQEKAAAGVPKSQLKSNEKAMNIQCDICKSTFLSTTREGALGEHALNKHSKTWQECFPGVTPQPDKVKK